MEVSKFVELYDEFKVLSDLANLFGVDFMILFMYQLISYKPKATVENPCDSSFQVEFVLYLK